MLCLHSTLRQSLIHFLLLWTSVSSLPTSSNLQQNYNNRRRLERDASNEFPQNGPLELVLQNDFLEFKICCTNYGGCFPGDFKFCFETIEQRQGSGLINGCGEGTCAYSLNYNGTNIFYFMGYKFSAINSCFNGKLTNERMYVTYSGIEQESHSCPLAIKSGNRLKLHVLSIPDGVTVTATNAQKYVEPTTSTSPPQNSNETISETELEKKEGMSDGLKYGLIGIGVLVFLLIVGGGIYGIYTWRKSKKNPKPAPSTTVIKDKNPNEKIETKTKPLVVKQKDVKKVKNETKKDERRPKAPPTDAFSSAEPQPSKEPITKPSAEPEPLQQLSKEPSVVPPSVEPSKPPPELPKATITIAELITRAERNRHRGKLGDTFDRLKKPAFENIFKSMIRHKWISENEALVLIEKYPRPPSEDELLLFSLPIGDMFLKLERMIDAAIKRHHDHPEDTPCRLIRNPNVTYFVSHFAIVLHYAQFFKLKRNDGFFSYSVPLCLGIAMDRNQDIPIRRRALVAMVQTAVDLTRFFNEGQCLKLPYPMNILCLSFQLDNYLPRNVAKLHTFSSPNNSECTKSDGSKGKSGQSVATENGGGSSSSKPSKISVSKEIVVAQKKKAKRKR